MKWLPIHRLQWRYAGGLPKSLYQQPFTTYLTRTSTAATPVHTLSIRETWISMFSKDVKAVQCRLTQSKTARFAHGDDSFGGALGAPSDDICRPCCWPVCLMSFLYLVFPPIVTM